MTDGKRTLLFSDEGLNFEISPYSGSGYPLAADKAYLAGVEREWHGQPNPGTYETPPAIYEISLYGSVKVRRLFETKQNMTPALVNSTGTRAAFQAFEDGKYTYFIYDIPSWKLRHSIELSKLLGLHCADCLPSSAVWSADGSRLFLTLDLGDEDGIADESQDRPGTCVISEDGTELGALAAPSGRIQLTGSHRQASIAPYLIGQFSNGNYLFRDYALKKGTSAKAPLQSQAILVISGPDFKVQQQIPLERFRLAQFQSSASGKYLAFVEDRQTPDYRTEQHLWAKDLQSGEEKELFAAPPPNPPTSLEPNVTVVPLGWIEK